MPISCKTKSTVPLDSPEYFKSLQDLDAHYSKSRSHPKQRGVLPYIPRTVNVDGTRLDDEHSGRLLVGNMWTYNDMECLIGCISCRFVMITRLVQHAP